MKKNSPTSTVRYIGELRCESEHMKSGMVIQSDAPTDNHGKGMTFSPTDLLATSLAKCMLTVMGIKANDMEGKLDGSYAEVYKIMASNPRRVDEIKVRLHLSSSSFSDKEKKVLEKTALTCPVAKSLSSDLTQDVEFEWMD